MDDAHSVDDVDLRSRSIRGASALLVGQVFRFAISMASQIYLARLLLPADFGLLAMIGPVIGFVTLFADFGLLQAVVQRRTVSQALLSSVFWINLAISIGLALLFAALTPILMFVYDEPRVGPIGFVSSAMIAVTGLAQVSGALLGRRLQFVPMVAMDVIGLLVGLAVGVAGARHGLGYWALVWSQVATSLTTTALTLILAKWRPSAPRREPEVAAMLRFGGQITGSKVIGYLNSTVDTMLVGVALGERALGIYDRAWRLAALPLGQLCAPIDRLAVPVLSRLQDDPERYRRAFVQMLRLLGLLAMPGLLYGVVAADRLIPTLLGPQWIGAIDIFRWVCIGAVISPLNNACFWLFVTQNRAGDQLRVFSIVAVINVASYAVGLIWGLEGVARCSALSVYLLQCPILVHAATKTGPVDRAAFIRAAWPALAAVGAVAPLLYLLVHALPGGSVLAILVGGAAAYGLIGAALTCFPSGRTTLAMAWSVAPARVTAPVDAALARVFARLRPRTDG